MKVIGMKVQNLCNLQLVEAQLDGRDLIVGGKNGGGKTSALRAIEVALRGGKSGKILDPIRSGEKRAEVFLDLGEYTVTKRFNPSGDTLTVRTKTGLKAENAQSFLSNLLGSISINPAEFLAMTNRVQLDTLLEICPVELDLEAHEKAYKELYEERAGINRDAKNVAGEMAGMELPMEGLPSEEVSVMDLINVRQEAQKDIDAVEEKKKALDEMLHKGESITKEIAAEEAIIEELPVELAKRLSLAEADYAEIILEIRKEIEDRGEYATSSIEQRKEDLLRVSDLHNQTMVEINGAVILDLDEIDKDINNVEETNRNIRSAILFQEKTKHLDSIKAKASTMSAQLKKMLSDKAKALDNAKIPVPEISVGDGLILYNGHPFSEASHAQQVAAALQLLIAQKPELKIITLQDASLMDEDTTALVRKVADEQGYQIFMEVVANNSDQMAIHISEGDAGLFLTDGVVTDTVGLEQPVNEEDPAEAETVKEETAEEESVGEKTEEAPFSFGKPGDI